MRPTEEPTQQPNVSLYVQDIFGHSNEFIQLSGSYFFSNIRPCYVFLVHFVACKRDTTIILFDMHTKPNMIHLLLIRSYFGCNGMKIF